MFATSNLMNGSTDFNHWIEAKIALSKYLPNLGWQFEYKSIISQDTPSQRFRHKHLELFQDMFSSQMQTEEFLFRKTYAIISSFVKRFLVFRQVSSKFPLMNIQDMR